MWNSRCSNPTGNILYNHARNADYTVLVPDTPTFFPAVPGHRPDVIDITLLKLPQLQIETLNISDLSSNHNPVLLTISNSSISTTPPINNKFINWTGYASTLEKSIHINQPTSTTDEIDAAIDLLTQNITQATETNSHLMKNKPSYNNILQEVRDEITSKNRFRREWNRYCNPTTKRQLNNKIKFIKAALKTHKQDQWDKFLHSLNPHKGDIHKLNKRLLNKKRAFHPLNSPQGLVYAAREKVELFADEFEKQFIANLGIDLPEVITSIVALKSTPIN